MKTVRVSDEMHALLTARKGQLIAETGKMQTFTDVVAALVKRLPCLKPELLKQVEELVRNDQKRHPSVEDFVENAVKLALVHATEEGLKPTG